MRDCNWLQKIQFDWSKTHPVHSISQSQLQLDKHPEVFNFQEQTGTNQNEKANIFVNVEVRPRFFHLSPIPCALHQKVEAELDHLKQAGIVIEPMQLSY